jgi:hypothetical protein
MMAHQDPVDLAQGRPSRFATHCRHFPQQEEIMMPCFDVRFIKTVCDDTGHEHRTCQAAFTIDAASLSEAVQRAEADFCRQKHVRDWTIFADAVEFRSPSRLERAVA